jgi:16S rRNA (uracil1498-N3)-methyltransferase
MHRCWLDTLPPPAVGEVVTLSAEESAHIARVLRIRVGDAVQLIAADGLYAATVVVADEKVAILRVGEALPSPECPVRLTLVQGLPKLDKLELIVQKATELGVWSVLPVEMKRSVSRLDGKEEKKAERLRRIALEAVKQSGRAHVPDIRMACRLEDALPELAGGHDAVLVAWEEEHAHHLGEAVKVLRAEKPNLSSIALVIGPEGGMTEKEIDSLRAIAARCVTLGKRILRTETAGLCALAVVQCALGEM